MAPREVVILGSTGSVGTQAIDIVKRNPDKFRVVGLAAGGSDPHMLAAQALDLGVDAWRSRRPARRRTCYWRSTPRPQHRGFSAGSTRCRRCWPVRTPPRRSPPSNVTWSSTPSRVRLDFGRRHALRRGAKSSRSPTRSR